MWLLVLMDAINIMRPNHKQVAGVDRRIAIDRDIGRF